MSGSRAAPPATSKAGSTLAKALSMPCSPSKPSCVDPELLSTPERALRARQGYVDVSPHGEEQRCGGCQFFSATDDGCGLCRILDGPVARTGHCKAWAAVATEPT